MRRTTHETVPTAHASDPNPWLEALARSMWLNPFWLVPPARTITRELDRRAAQTTGRR